MLKTFGHRDVVHLLMLRSPHCPEGTRKTTMAPRIALLACLVLYLAVGYLLSRQQDFWSPDSAVRFVQTEGLWRNGYRDVSVPYPAASLDPEGRFFPAGPWFHFQRDGKHYLSYLPYFPALSSLPYRAFGYPGLLVLPIAAGLGAVWLTGSVLQRHAPTLALWGMLVLGVGTPLVIYSTVFWDHSLVVVLSAGALALAAGSCEVRGQPQPAALFLSGSLIGLGAWFRNEMYLLGLSTLLVWAVVARRRRASGLVALVGGLALAVGILWTANLYLYGSPMGWKGQGLVTGRVGSAVGAVAGGSLTSWIADKLGNVYYQLISPDFYAFNLQAVLTGLGLAATLVIAGGLMRVGVHRRSQRVTALGGALAVVTSVAILSERTVISGLLPAAPFVVLAFLCGPLSRWDWFLWGVTVTFCGAVIVTGTHGGLQWGPRYLLPILPPAIWLAAAAVARARTAAPRIWPTLKLAVGGIGTVSLLIQAVGVDVVGQSINRNARINGALRQAPADVVVTSLEWLALGAGQVYFAKQLMFVSNVQDFQALVGGLVERRVSRWTYVPVSGPLFGPSIVEKWTASAAWRFRLESDEIHSGLRLVTFAGAPASP